MKKELERDGLGWGRLQDEVKTHVSRWAAHKVGEQLQLQSSPQGVRVWVSRRAP